MEKNKKVYKRRFKPFSKKKKFCLTISKRNTRSSSSTSIKNSEQIPVDLIIDIFLRLPVKSISRFRCVSKKWASILCRPDFTDLFLTKSFSSPRLLFSLKTKRKWFFFSAPQPLNPVQTSSAIVVDYHMSFPTIKCSPHIHAPVFGLICTKNIWLTRGCNASEVMIYNPSTGQTIPLPLMRRRRVDVRTYFGYDPINKQYKVLCMSIPRRPLKAADEYQVLTLGTGKLSWNMIECSLEHFPTCPGTCINGVLYYLAGKENGTWDAYTIVCFDVMSEKFKFIETPKNVTLTRRSTMINYCSKLGVLLDDHIGFSSETTSIELWVADDVEKNKWSHRIYVLPPLWRNLVADTKLHIVGMTGNDELVLSPRVLLDPFYIFFYNLEKNSIVRVRIQGIESTTKRQYIRTYIDHIQDVKRM
ncbi:F-box protein [Cardamine amara subsp. amara]|uniref:F-box protein n=1 Tax=Cardamine amara subsp. amara TaxID=228776 RepID=A0ABD1ALX2_CARAN